MVTSFSKRVVLLGRKIDAVDTALLDGDHIFWNGKNCIMKDVRLMPLYDEEGADSGLTISVENADPKKNSLPILWSDRQFSRKREDRTTHTSTESWWRRPF